MDGAIGRQTGATAELTTETATAEQCHILGNKENGRNCSRRQVVACLPWTCILGAWWWYCVVSQAVEEVVHTRVANF